MRPITLLSHVQEEKKNEKKKVEKTERKKRKQKKRCTLDGGDGFRCNEDVFPQNDQIRFEY